MNGRCESDILALLNHSPTILHTTPARISFNSNPHTIFISKKIPVVKTTCDYSNMKNNWMENRSTSLIEKSHENSIQHSDNSDLKLDNYPSNFTSVNSNSTDESNNKRRKFSPEEDIQLLKLISIQGPKKWDQIALSMPGRTGRQCRDRFNNYLEPSLTNGPWTIEEDILLEQKVVEIGQHWNIIAKFFKGRSTNNIKNRWYTYVCCEKKGQSQKLLSSKNKNNGYQNNYHLSNNFGNNFVSHFKNDQYTNMYYQNNYFDFQYPNNSYIPIIPLNANTSKKSSSKSNFHDHDIYSKKNNNEKKLLFPSLIPTDSNIVLF